MGQGEVDSLTRNNTKPISLISHIPFISWEIMYVGGSENYSLFQMILAKNIILSLVSDSQVQLYILSDNSPWVKTTGSYICDWT